MQRTANQLKVDSPSFPQKQRAPKHYESTGYEVVFPELVEERYHPIPFEGIDRIVSGIEMRFDKPAISST